MVSSDCVLEKTSTHRPQSGNLFPAATTFVPTVTDNLYDQGIIPKPFVGIAFEPTASMNLTNGELTFGAADQSKYTDEMNFV